MRRQISTRRRSSALPENTMVSPGKMRMARGEVPLDRESRKRSSRVTHQKSQPQPYHGYYFKVLKGQGPAAPLGQMDFVVEGAMISGFALAAAPAQYRVTGVKTFIVGPNGIVYEKDLGPDTLKTFQDMDRYNPDKTWKPTDDDWPEEAQSSDSDSSSPQ